MEADGGGDGGCLRAMGGDSGGDEGGSKGIGGDGSGPYAPSMRPLCADGVDEAGMEESIPLAPLHFGRWD